MLIKKRFREMASNGMRRKITAENDAETTLVQKARQRIQRFIFCAKRTMWLSACELGVFLTTGSSCVHTEKVFKVFSGKPIAMMHECKRLLNQSTSADGLLVAHSSARPSKSTSMDAFLVPQHEDADADEDSAATEDADTEADADSAAAEHTDNDTTPDGDRAAT